MAEFWDKLKSELDKAGKVAQEAIDEGKLRIELFRLRQAADKSAQALGYAVYKARKDGHDPDPDTYSRLLSTMAEQEAEMLRIEQELRRLGVTDPAADSPAPGGATSEPPTGT